MFSTASKKSAFCVALLAAVFAATSGASLAQSQAPQPSAAPVKVEAKTAKNKEVKPLWAQLSTEQQKILNPLEPDWAGLDAPRKQKWLAFAKRYPQLSPAEQTRAQERMQQWAKLTPAQRQAARDNFMATQNGKPAGEADLSAKWEAYQALSPEKKAELAEKARQNEATKKGVPAASSAAVTAKERPLKTTN